MEINDSGEIRKKLRIVFYPSLCHITCQFPSIFGDSEKKYNIEIEIKLSGFYL